MHLTGLQKVLVYCALVGATLWLGGSVLRIAIAFDLMQPGTLLYRADLSDEQVWHGIRLFTTTYFYTGVGYVLALGGFIPVFVSLRRMWKTQGWLFMAGILFFLYIPVECLHLYYDSRLLDITEAGYSAETLAAAKVALFERFDDIQIFTFLALLAYLSALAILVWRPLGSVTPLPDEKAEQESLPG